MTASSRKLLIIGHNWPEPGATAAGKRMIQLLECMAGRDFHVTFASAATRGTYAIDLNTLGVDEAVIQLNNSSFDSFVQRLTPDIVIFDRFITEEQFGWRVAEALPDCLRILNTEDLHSLRLAREQELAQNLPADSRRWLDSELTKRELASIFRCDLSLIISSHEMSLLVGEAAMPEALLHYFPLWIPERKDVKPKVFEERRDFIFIGNGKHRPNLDAIYHLHRSIWPLIRSEIPAASLQVYGAYLPKKIYDLNDPDQGIFIRGHIEDSFSVMEAARVNLAPLRYGAGLKGKIIEAMYCGTPTVATSVGMEGIIEEDQSVDLSRDRPENFAKRAVRLYSDKSLWEKQQKYEAGLLGRFSDRKAFEDAMHLRLEAIQKNLEEHRRSNLVGRILLHHVSASTKYMAKWIELKNLKHVTGIPYEQK